MSTKCNFYEKIAIGALAIASIFSLVRPTTGADTGAFQKVEPNQVPDELAMLADVTQANYEKIKTWQGKISFEDMIIYQGAYAADLLERYAGVTIKEPNELGQMAMGTKAFKIDMEKNLLFKYMNWPKPTEFIDFDNSVIYPSLSKPVEVTKIITGEYEIESSPYTFKEDGTILSRLARKRPRNPSQIDSDESDPRYCFSIGQFPWVLLPRISEWVHRQNTDPNDSLALEKAQTAEGAIYRIQLKNSLFEWKYTFEEEKGFNPTHIEVKNNKGIKISEGTVDWIKIQGIFLPSEKQVFQYDGDNGLLRRQAKSTFSDMQVNITLPEGTFSLNNLSLKNGDKFIDKIEGKEYTYQDTNLVPVAGPNK